MVDALVSMEGQVKQRENRLVVGHIGGLEDRPRRLTELLGAYIVLTLAQQALASSAIQVAEADASATLEALPHKARTDSIRTT